MASAKKSTIKDSEEVPERIECSLLLIDLSGFTQLIYQASHRDEVFQIVARTIKRLFQDAVLSAAATKEVRIISTTGDGFIAIATGAQPSRTALRYALEVRAHFDRFVKSVIHSMPFRQRIDLRIALHHGIVHRIPIKGLLEGDTPIYLGDDLILVCRLIDSQTARRHGVALTRSFYRRLMLKKKGQLPTADEVILDRNRYPEPVDVYRLPADIPDFNKTKTSS